MNAIGLRLNNNRYQLENRLSVTIRRLLPSCYKLCASNPTRSLQRVHAVPCLSIWFQYNLSNFKISRDVTYGRLRISGEESYKLYDYSPDISILSEVTRLYSELPIITHKRDIFWYFLRIGMHLLQSWYLTCTRAIHGRVEIETTSLKLTKSCI